MLSLSQRPGPAADIMSYNNGGGVFLTKNLRRDPGLDPGAFAFFLCKVFPFF